jgi:hypothetical protein
MITNLSLVNLLSTADQLQQYLQSNAAEKTVPTLQKIVAKKVLAQAQENYSCVIDICQLITLKAAVHLLKAAVEKEIQEQFAETSTGQEIITAAENFNSVADHIIESLLAASASAKDQLPAVTTKVSSNILSEAVKISAEAQSEGVNKPLPTATVRSQLDHNARLQAYLNNEELETAFEYASQYIDKIDINYKEGILLLRAAEYGDSRLIVLLLKELDKVDSEVLLEALKEAAHSGYAVATKLLFDCFINKQGKSVKEVKKLEQEIKITTAYDNFPSIKELFDNLFSNNLILTENSE